MKQILLIALFALLAVVPAPVLSAGFTVDGASVSLTGLMVLSTDDDVSLLSGTLNAGSAQVQVGGNWTHANGEFVPGTSTVTFQGVPSSITTLTGSTTFYSLQCLIPGKTLNFTIGSTQTVMGSLILAGNVNNLLRLRSTVFGSQAYLTSLGTNTITHVDAQDNDAGGGVMMMAGSSSVDSGNTVNWFFGPLSTRPQVFAGVALSASSIRWTWNGVPGAASYNLYDLGAPAIVIASVTSNRFTEIGLLPQTTYGRAVRSVVGGMESSLSNSDNVATWATASVGAPIANDFDLLPGSPYPRILTPNRPDNRRLFFLFSNPNSDPVAISIYDVRNRKVRDLNEITSVPVPGTMVWDVKDDSGRVVPGGMYFYKVKAGSTTKTGSVVVAR